MTSRGSGTEAAKSIFGDGTVTKVTDLEVGINALERGIARRSRRIVAPWWVGAVLPVRSIAQPVVDRALRAKVAGVLAIARDERVELTTPQGKQAEGERA